MILGENLNKTFGPVYLRNLPKAVNRLASFQNTAKRIGLEYTTIKAIDGQEYVPADYLIKHASEDYPYPTNQYLMGNFYSTMYILLDAMSNNYESYVYCDDDTIFNDVDIPYLKPELPDDWDIIILGRLFLNDQYGPLRFISTDDEWYISGSHCVAVHKRAYYTLMEHYLKMDTDGIFGDRLYQHLVAQNKIKLYVMLPDITHQERTVLTPYTIK